MNILQLLGLKPKIVSPLPENRYVSPLPEKVRPEVQFNQPTEIPAKPPSQSIPGLVAPQPPQYANLIQKSAQQSNVHPALLAALLYQESRYNPQAVNPDSKDFGIAQINLKANPGISKTQALNPEFAIPWAAQRLAQEKSHFNNPSRALAAYNVGRGGASVEGPEPFGGGPLGQRYIDNVSRNLAADLIARLGLVTSNN